MGFERFFCVPYGSRLGTKWKPLGKAWSKDPAVAQREAEERLGDIVHVAQTLGIATEAQLLSEGRLWAGPGEVGWPSAEIVKVLRESDSVLEETDEVSALLGDS